MMSCFSKKCFGLLAILLSLNANSMNQASNLSNDLEEQYKAASDHTKQSIAEAHNSIEEVKNSINEVFTALQNLEAFTQERP